MDPQSSFNYQRAVTPTIESSKETLSGNTVRGKVLSYQNQQIRGVSKSSKSHVNVSSAAPVDPTRSSSASPSTRTNTLLNSTNNQTMYSPTRILHRGMAAPGSNMFSSQSNDLNLQGRSVGQGSTVFNSRFEDSINLFNAENLNPMSSMSSYSRFDIIPLTDEIPNDGILFARIRNHPESLVIFRTNEERNRNPERLNLDRRLLDVCPILENEHRLRLLNYQNNNIKIIHNIENLHNLIFLDMYNNKLTTLDGPLSSIRGLRVLMAGKNKISNISNLMTLKKLDVLDLHSNDIRVIEGLDCLCELRVLNLAGNRINIVQNLATLHALTELNLRRNSIDKIYDLDRLPSLQRVFLSHNNISNLSDISCVFNIKMLIELSLDGNPISDNACVENNHDLFRYKIISSINSLRYLDLKRVTEEERLLANEALTNSRHIYNDTDNDFSKINHNDTEYVYNDKITDLDNSKLLFSQDVNINSTVYSNINNNTSNDNVVMSELNDFNRKGLIQSSKDDSMLQGNAINDSYSNMARAGKVSSFQSMFELEVIGPNEKALIIAGDSWEFMSNKRMLCNVVELSLCHIDKEIINMKFADSNNWFSSIRCLRLIDNNIDALKDLQLISDFFTPTIEELYISDNLVVSSTTYELFKSYIITKAPMIKTINNLPISNVDKIEAIKKFQPILRIVELNALAVSAKPIALQKSAPKLFKDSKKSNLNNNLTSNEDLYAIEQYTQLTLQTIKSLQIKKSICEVNFNFEANF